MADFRINAKQLKRNFFDALDPLLQNHLIMNFMHYFLLLILCSQINALLPPGLNETSCIQYGYNVTNFQYNLILKSYNGKGGVFLPIFSNIPLNRTIDGNKVRATILVHGLLRNAADQFCEALNASSASLNDSIIIAPWFADEEVTSQFWSPQSEQYNYEGVYWESNNWLDGGDNSNSNEVYNITGYDDYISILDNITFGTYSSFTPLDDLVQILLNYNIYPNITTISLIGFSAGGQTIQRYGWATSVTNITGRPFSGRSIPSTVSTELIYVVSDPSSYLYLDATRPNGSCLAKENTGINATCSLFLTPAPAFINQCSTYNHWKYGTAYFPLNGYTYLNKYHFNATLVALQSSLFRGRDVRYVFGAKDNCNCNVAGYINEDYCFITTASCSPDAYGGQYCCDTWPDSENNDLSTSCPSEIQGFNRLQRGIMYMQYLKEYWSAYDYTPFYATVPYMQHDTPDFLNSKYVKLWSFGIDETMDDQPSNSSKPFFTLYVIIVKKGGSSTNDNNNNNNNNNETKEIGDVVANDDNNDEEDPLEEHNNNDNNNRTSVELRLSNKSDKNDNNSSKNNDDEQESVLNPITTTEDV
eukprot:gene16048-21787_t